jgi:hypothetical protein
MTDFNATNTTVHFQKGDDRLAIWTNNKDRWTFTDFTTHKTRSYTQQLAMALSASLAAEGYAMTIHR